MADNEPLHDIVCLDVYQNKAAQTNKEVAEFPEFVSPELMKHALGISGERGEVAEKVKKAIREDDPSYLDDALTELGDLLWYVSQFADELDTNLSEVATENVVKLTDREERGQITGEGDQR